MSVSQVSCFSVSRVDWTRCKIWHRRGISRQLYNESKEVRRDWADAGACLKCSPWTSELGNEGDIPGVNVELSVAA
jgi:hypothetical protein